MYSFRHVSDLQHYLSKQQVNNRTVGFVPTMGALHEGHLSLLRRSLADNQVTVCSIFVNPTQFNDAEDLAKYPRLPAKDLRLLHGVGCQVVFLPAVEDIYPPGLSTEVAVDLQGLDLPMEGANRPGHFAGVVQVVHRLLQIVKPDHLYMGQKDFQQQAIIRRMVQALELPVKVHTIPTVRETDGLALSSRNVRLSPSQRAVAARIYASLQVAAEQLAAGWPIERIEASALQALDSPPLKPEYFTLADADTLEPLAGDASQIERIVACTAVWAGNTRLIDNHLLRGRL
jgi:pantoate--beta-alanine ligase